MVRGFFADSTSLDFLALRPLSHIRPNWELMWDEATQRYLEEAGSLASLMNDLIGELEACDPPVAYHDNEDRLAEFARDRLKWPITKVGRRWLGLEYDTILEQGGFDDCDERELVLAASGRIRAARNRGQATFDEMEPSHRKNARIGDCDNSLSSSYRISLIPLSWPPDHDAPADFGPRL